MSHPRTTGFAKLAAIAGLASALAVPGAATAQTTYGVAMLSDFSGPYADVMPLLGRGREVVFDWWNAEVGSKLGVRLNYKNFDTRYDTAQTASLWPGIKSEMKPIAVVGLGGPDVAALGPRLNDDAVPLFMSTAGYGYAWKPDSWIINPRPTYAHEMAGAFRWLKGQRGGTQPLKVGVISSEASPAYVDIARGIERYAKDNPGEVQLIEVIFTEVQPTDLTTQVRRLVRGGVEAIAIQTNTAAVVATKRALQALNAKVPIIMSSHNGLPASGKAAGGLNQMEGDYEVYGMAIASDEDSPARRFYEKLKADHKLAAPWNVLTVMGMAQGAYTVRAIEHAIRKHGAQNLTGTKVRETLLSTPVTSEETFGLLPTLKFTKEAPFPVEGLKVNIATVKGGKYVTAATNVDTPVVNKW